jgi:hypothetical protein
MLSSTDDDVVVDAELGDGKRCRLALLKAEECHEWRVALEFQQRQRRSLGIVVTNVVVVGTW